MRKWKKQLYYDMQSHTCSFKMFSLIYTWYIRSALYPLYVGSADGEFIIFLRIHIIRDEEKKNFLYNSFQLKKIPGHKMLNDSILIFFLTEQIIVCNNIECCMYPTWWFALPQFFSFLKVTDTVSGFFVFRYTHIYLLLSDHEWLCCNYWYL